MRYVLVTPVGGHKLYSMPMYYKYVSNLNQQPDEIWLSCTDYIYEQCMESYNLSIPIRHIHGDDDTGDDQIHSTTSAREALRRAILESDYEWTMWLDNDILAPQDMVEVAEAYLQQEPDLLWIHSFHPCRQDGGETDRHGISSSFIHRELLNIPFIMIVVNGRHLGDDFLWINWANLFIKMGKVNIKQGRLFNVKHYREDGVVVEWKDI